MNSIIADNSNTEHIIVKGIPAKYLLFDSWFAFPRTIANVVKRKLNVISMLKSAPKSITPF